MKPANTQDEHKTARPSKQDDAGIESAAVVLAQIDEGALNAELSDAFREVVGKLERLAADTLKDQRGTITLKLGLAVSPKGDVVIAGDVAVKTPKRPAGASRFWISKNGLLTVKNPKQQALPFREVVGRHDVIDLGEIGGEQHAPRSV
jgi:hypothetical protein